MSSDLPPTMPVWYRVRVALRNSRRLAGRVEHPCHILHAILMSVLRNDRRTPIPVWSWRPTGAERWRDAVEKGRLYELAVLFAGDEPARQFAERLPQAPIQNFTVESVHAPELRSFPVIEAEIPAPDWTVEEVCLDFITPLAWEARPGPARWQLDAARLVRMLYHRLAHFLGLPEPGEDAALPAIEVRTAFTDLVGGHAHRSKSGPGTELAFAGLRGPVYLRGDWPALWIPLLVGSELQLGSNTTCGQGCYRLAFDRPFFDLQLETRQTWQRALRIFRYREQTKGKEAGAGLPADEDLPALAATASAGTLQLAPAILCEIPKKAAETPAEPAEKRLIAVLPVREQFVHFVLHRLLQPVLERLFLPESIGSRPGQSREDAQPMIQEALYAGCTHVIQADVEDFFDHIDWDVLDRQLEQNLPCADSATLALLRHCVRQTLTDRHSQPLVRRAGVLQGSPLSSILANLYLHQWDLAMRARGWQFVRAVDDIRIFAKSDEEAQRALADAVEALGPLGLRFKPAKLAIIDLRATHAFRFLGLTFGADETPGHEDAAPLRRPLYLIRPETWAGVEEGALVVRQGDRLEQRAPLHRVSEVVLLGAGGISIGLIEACLRQRIPISLCSQAGRHHGTLYPDTRGVFARIARHHRRHEELGPAGRAVQAARLIQAKLANYLFWVEEHSAPELTALRRTLRARHDSAGIEAAGPDPAAAIDAIRGHEGAAARSLFPWVNARAHDPDWASAARLPHERRDRWNLLLDTLSFLFFNRLHTACLSRGLDPWLGFLHSPDDRYPSLVYDLMEPFRARLDRFAVWLVNEGAITPGLLALDADARWGFTADGWRALILQFEKHLNLAYAADEGRTFRQLLDRQVADLVLWVDQGVDLRLHARPFSPWRKPPSRPSRRQA